MAGAVCLFHWNAAEAAERAEALGTEGYDVRTLPRFGPALLRELAESPPAAFVVDLTRLPSQGRDVALSLRARLGTRHVPLVLVDGKAEALEQLRQLLPDATYTTARKLPGAVAAAIASPPRNPVVPLSVLAGYSGKPLPKKLGIKPGATVALIGAPKDFEVGPLPSGAAIRAHAPGRFDLAIWFVRSKKELRPDRLVALARNGPLWIAWPKKASGVRSDLSETVVRRTGLDHGLVDYKICAIDATWSGLCFRRRK